VSEPTPEQRRLLNAIWASFCREGSWPSFLGIDQLLDREGLAVRPLIHSMPLGVMTPDGSSIGSQYSPRANDELRVQVGGLRHCDDTESELQLLARVMGYIAERERTFELPSLSTPEPLIVSSTEAQADLGLSDEEVARAYALLTTFAWGVLDGGGGNPEQWSFQIDVEGARPYRNVQTAEEYLAVRGEQDRPRLPMLPTPPARATTAYPVTANVEQPLVAEHRVWSKVIAPLLRHPIVSTIIGGLILALLAALFGLR
jgi:hypothetical protein